MQQNELKAILKKTNQVAIFPEHIENTLPGNVGQKNRMGRYICPRGLTRATVIEDGHHWVERRPVAACGDRDYEIPRRNGVLVEFQLDERHVNYVIAKGELRYKTTQDGKIVRVPHSEVVERDGESFVRLIISRKAVISAWDEYELIEAQRAKESEEAKARQDRLVNAQKALMNGTYEKFAEKITSPRYVNLYDKNGKKTGTIGTITITIDDAERIIETLNDLHEAAINS